MATLPFETPDALPEMEGASGALPFELEIPEDRPKTKLGRLLGKDAEPGTARYAAEGIIGGAEAGGRTIWDIITTTLGGAAHLPASLYEGAKEALKQEKAGKGKVTSISEGYAKSGDVMKDLLANSQERIGSEAVIPERIAAPTKANEELINHGFESWITSHGDAAEWLAKLPPKAYQAFTNEMRKKYNLPAKEYNTPEKLIAGIKTAAEVVGNFDLPMGGYAARPKPGTIPRQTPESLAKARATYETPEAKAETAQFNRAAEARAIEQQRQRDQAQYGQQADLPFEVAAEEARYRGGNMGGILDPKERARIEAEIADQVGIQRQGELFDGVPLRSPDEMQARELLGEGATGNRDRISPRESQFEIGKETEMPFIEAQQFDRPGLGRGPDETIPYVKPGEKGTIHPDLLTFGVNRIIERFKNEGRDEPLVRAAAMFKGTFNPSKLKMEIERARDPNSRSTIMFMTPDQFHELAQKRIDEPVIGYDREGLRGNIRKGLKTEKGLDDLLYLEVIHDKSLPYGTLKVIAHEGRHRMDVFKEQGIDLIPVVLKSDKRGFWADDPKTKFSRLEGENGTSIEMPWENMIEPTAHKTAVEHRTTWNPLEGPGRRQAGLIQIFGKNDRKVGGGVAKILQAAREQFNVDTRKLKDTVAEENIKPETTQDIPGNLRWDLGIDKSISIITQKYPGAGKIIKWAVDHRRTIDRLKDVRINEGIRAALDPWKNTKNKRDLREMLDTWIEKIGADRALTREDFKSERQFRVYEAVSKSLEDLRVRVNAARAKEGLPPISKIENYLPAMWEGDYYVSVKDAANQTKAVFRFKSLREAEHAQKEIKAKHSDMNVSQAKHNEASRGADLTDLSAFEEAIRVMSRTNDPITSALQRTYAELRSSGGFAKHGLERKNVGGFMGWEPGMAGVTNMEKAIAQYIKQGETHIANLEKANLQKQLNDKDMKPIMDKMPNAKQYLEDYIQQAKGADLSGQGYVKALFEGMGKVSGQGSSAWRRYTSGISQLMGVYWLTNFRFAVSQIIQPINALAKMVDIKGMEPLARNPMAALAEGYRQLLAPDAGFKKAAAWAEKNGYLDGTIVSLLQLKMADLEGNRLGKIGDLSGWALNKLEHHLVRSNAFSMFEYQLRDVVKEPEARYKMAAEYMSHYMVEYNKGSSPMIYNKMGPVGAMARPLKQYAHNTYGQFIEYLLTAKDQKRMAPLATFLGSQVAVGGLKGTMLVAEATAIITLLNAVFNSDIPTPEELLLESKLPDAAIFGGASTALGYDISGSVAAPSMPNMFSLPVVDFVKKAGEGMVGLQFLYKLTNGTATDADKLKAALALTPNAMAGFWEELYSQPDGPVPNPNRGMRGDHVRTPHERDMARYLSIKSMDEARDNMVARVARNILARDLKQKTGALNVITDYVINNKDIPPELIERYTEEGGNPAHLARAVRERIIERQLPYEENAMRGGMTLDKVHRLEAIKKLLDDETDIPETSPSQESQGTGGGPGGKTSKFTAPTPEQIKTIASEEGIPPDLFYRIAKAENVKHDPHATSKAGAKGVMQMMPATFKQYGGKDINDPEDNIRTSAKYMKYLLNRFNGDVRKAVAAYNAGPNRTAKSIKDTGDIPQNPETKAYVKKILGEEDNSSPYKKMGYQARGRIKDPYPNKDKMDTAEKSSRWWYNEEVIKDSGIHIDQKALETQRDRIRGYNVPHNKWKKKYKQGEFPEREV